VPRFRLRWPRWPRFRFWRPSAADQPGSPGEYYTIWK
jgi:hypothetical protein